MRVLFVGGGLVALLIIFSIVKGLLTGPSNLDAFVGIVQDQQELIHLVSSAATQQNISTTNLNFSSTANLSLGTSQSNLIQYLANNHKKVAPKQLGLKVSSTIDNQLTTASAATTYNQTYKEIMTNKLSDYSNDLKQAYDQTKGQKGRALLSDTYDQAQLLSAQLAQTATN